MLTVHYRFSAMLAAYQMKLPGHAGLPAAPRCLGMHASDAQPLLLLQSLLLCCMTQLAHAACPAPQVHMLWCSYFISHITRANILLRLCSSAGRKPQSQRHILQFTKKGAEWYNSRCNQRWGVSCRRRETGASCREAASRCRRGWMACAAVLRRRRRRSGRRACPSTPGTPTRRCREAACSFCRSL